LAGVLPRDEVGLAGAPVMAGMSGIRTGLANSVRPRTTRADLLGTSWTESLRLDETSAPRTIVVPPPNGVSSVDTPNIRQALHSAKRGTAFDEELPVFPRVRLTGQGPTMESVSGVLPTLQQVAGVSLRWIAASASCLAGLCGPASPGKYPHFNFLHDRGVQRSTVVGAI
jgi:hypothetical protein